MSIMKELLLKAITLIHVIFVLFVVGTPFIGSNYFLLLHAIFVPFMMIHWLCNDNTCCLTIVERNLRKHMSGKKKYNDEDCITCKIIEPVYDFRKNYKTFSKIIYAITITLWLISLTRLYMKYKSGEIASFTDMFM